MELVELTFRQLRVRRNQDQTESTSCMQRQHAASSIRVWCVDSRLGGSARKRHVDDARWLAR